MIRRFNFAAAPRNAKAADITPEQPPTTHAMVGLSINEYQVARPVLRPAHTASTPATRKITKLRSDSGRPAATSREPSEPVGTLTLASLSSDSRKRRTAPA